MPLFMHTQRMVPFVLACFNMLEIIIFGHVLVGLCANPRLVDGWRPREHRVTSSTSAPPIQRSVGRARAIDTVLGGGEWMSV